MRGCRFKGTVAQAFLPWFFHGSTRGYDFNYTFVFAKLFEFFYGSSLLIKQTIQKLHRNFHRKETL